MCHRIRQKARALHDLLPERLCRRLQGSEGVAAVELAFTMILFLAIVIASIDAFRLSYQSVLSQFIVTRSIRRINVGDIDPRCTTGNMLARSRCTVEETAKSFGIPLDSSGTIDICEYAGDENCGAQSLGASGQLVLLRITFSITFLWYPDDWEIEAFAIGRNE